MAVEKGDKVTVEYEGKLEDGTVFDSSKHGDHSHPLEFVVGSGNLIKGFDENVVGMKKDEEKEFEIMPEDAYGSYREELKQDVPREILPKDPEPKEGMSLIMKTPEGGQFPVKISKVEKDTVTIDLNHPLAGKKLYFKVKVIEIEKASS